MEHIMNNSHKMLIMEINIGGQNVRARLLEEANPEVVKLVCSHLPLTTFALHPNVSGHGFLLPTMMTYTGPGYMVPRHPGAVYFFSLGQSIVFTYGETNETAPVNKFGQVLDEDLPKLAYVGKAIYHDTLVAAQHKIVRATVRLVSDPTDNVPPSSQAQDQLELTPPARTIGLKFVVGWKNAEATFMEEAKRALIDEPDEVFMSFAGIIPSGMGTGGNVLAVWLHQWACLISLGPNTLHKFLADSEIPSMTLDLMVNVTRNHLLDPFNYFNFLHDLGLAKFKVWGHMYATSIGHVETLQEYKQLTTALFTLVNVFHRRVQSRIPFYLGKCCPRISEEEILKLSHILEPTSNNHINQHIEN